MITIKTRMLFVSALVAVGGLALYIYSGSPSGSLQAELSTSVHLSQVEGIDATKVVSKKSDAVPAVDAQVAGSVMQNKAVPMASNDAPMSDDVIEQKQYQFNASVEPSLLSKSILSSRARIRQMAAVQHAGLSIEQRNVQVKYQLTVSRQRLDLVRNLLRQAQFQAALLKQGKVVAEESAANVLKLKARVSQMEIQLAAKSRQLNQPQLSSLTGSERLFGAAAAKRYAAGYSHRGF